jgi:NAD(P)-dependent dehydrogenase (short-subunit alcohol dehydrogenase family)
MDVGALREKLDEPLRVELLPWLSSRVSDVVLVQSDQVMRQLASYWPAAQQVGQLREPGKPIGVPAGPILVRTIRDPVDLMVGLGGLMQQVAHLVSQLAHRSHPSSPCVQNAAYHASKHGVLGLTRSAALEYAPRGIRINAICPGTIETPMVTQMIDSGDLNRAEAEANQPINRLGTAEEMAAAVLWLCSPGASFVIGVALPVDGGYTAR